MRKLTLALFTSLMLLFGLNIDIQGQTISSTAQRICVGDSVIIETYGVTVTGWSNGMSGNSIVVFPSTTTTYTATYWDAATQSNLQLQETIVVDALPDATISGNLSVCPGASTTLSVGMAASYLWSTGATTPTITVSPVQATDYWVEVTSNNGCVARDTIRVEVASLPDVAIEGAERICLGSGTYLKVPTGYSYSWSNGSIDSMIYVQPRATTTYYVTVTNAEGCSSVYSHLVTVLPEVSATITGTNTPICGGSSTTLTVTGGESYVWSHGLGNDATVTVSPTTNTTYYVTVTDGNGCQVTLSHTIDISSNVTATVAGALNICRDDSTTLMAGSADGYMWSTPSGVLISTNPTLTVAPTETTDYLLTVHNAQGCSDSKLVRVTVHEFPTTATIQGADTICVGDRLTLTVDDSNLFYSWSSGETTASITVSPLITTTYSCVVTNLYGCSATLTKTVVVNAKATGTISGDSVICAGASATLIATGGDHYVWSTGETGATITVNPTATTIYSVELFNAQGCQTTLQHVVRVTPNAVAQITGVSDICEGMSVRLTATGGTSYRWESGETTKSIVVTPMGDTTYRVWATDNGCESAEPAEFTVNVHAPLTGSVSGATVACVGTEVELTATGGSDYLWSTGERTATITVTPMSTSSYICLISNAGGCDTTITHTIQVMSAPSVSVVGNRAICEGESLTLRAIGADFYRWSGDVESEGDSLTVAPMVTTTYQLTAIGANGCETTRAITVVVNDFADAYVDGILNICPGASTTLTVQGNGVVSYLWNDSVTTATRTVSPTETTTYSVLLTHNSGCQKQLTVTVKVGEPLTPIVSGPAEMCLGEVITLTAVLPDGTDAQLYQWSNGQTGKSITISPATSTTYTVTAILPGGCSYIGSHQVNVHPVPNVTINGPIESCSGQPVVLTASGANNYTWDNGLTGAMITVYPTTTTLYEVTAINSFGCETKQTHLITINPMPNISIGGDSVICEGTSTTITAVGGSHYLWNTGAVTNSITVSPVVSSTYYVTVTSPTGCDTTLYYNVAVNSQPQGDITGNFMICAGDATTLTASGGVSYFWSNGATGPSITETPTVTTTYSVVVTNAQGCSQTISRSVIVNPLPTPVISGQTSICIGESTQLTATGAGAGGYYVWSTGEQGSTINILPSVTSTYSVTAVSRFGCQSKPTYVTVQVNRPPMVTIAGTRVICEGSSTMLTAQGTATSFLWNTGDTTASIQVTRAGTYTVQGYSAAGCMTTASTTVTVEDMANAKVMASEQYICNGELVTLTASGGDSYLWNDGSMTASISVNPSTTTSYSVIVYSLTGCQRTLSITVYVNELTITGNTSICKGQSTSLTAMGLGDNYYVWNTGDSSRTINVSPQQTTTYSVTAYSNRGCDVFGRITVQVYEFPTNLAIVGPDTVCALERGVLTATGGTAGTSYLWSTGERTPSINIKPTISQNYWVRLTAGSGCDTVLNHYVVAQTRPKAAITGPKAVCQGDSVVLTAVGGHSYLWSVNGSTQTQIKVAPNNTTTYELIAFSSAGCPDTTYHTVQVDRLPTVIITGANTSCAGDSIMLVASDGTTTSSYYWSNGMMGDTIWTVLYNTETLTATCTNSNGCVGEASFKVTVYNKPIPFIAGDNVICQGTSTVITASGGRSYLWNTGSRAAAIRVAPTVTTTYYVTVTGDGGCSETDSIVIYVIPRPTPSVTVGDDSIPLTQTSICRGSEVTLMAHGAGNNGTYFWRNASSTFTTYEQSITVSPTVSSYYYLTITTEDGCVNTLNFRVNVMVPAVPVISGPTTTCSNVPVTLTVSGIASNVKVLWSNEATTRSVTVNPTETTTYSLVATTTQGCDTTVYHTVTVDNAPNAVIDGPTAICEGERIVLIASGADYYLWPASGITSDRIAVSPTQTTTYTCEFTNMNGCTETVSHTIVVNQKSGAQIVANTSICNGDSLMLYVTDGTTTTTYVWDNGSINDVIWVKPLESTTYSVIATTENGCVDTITHSVTVYDYNEITIVGNTEICHGSGTQITLYGGVAYQWSTGATMQAVWLSPNVSTTYWVDVTSPGGCVERHYIDITVNILPQASVWMAGDFGATSSTTLCLGNTLSLEGHGAGTNGSYRWMDSNGNMISTTQTINVSPTQTTTYYLEVTNEHGCIATTFFVAYVLPLANMNVSASHMVICEGGTTVLQAGFPYDNLTYIWTEPDGTQTVGHTLTVAPMQTTTYQVQTNTYEGCLTRDSITIQVVPELTAAIQGPEIVCAGDSVTLTATEGDSYLWSNGAMTQSIQVAVQAYSSYTVSVTNSAGCVAFAVHDIDVYPVTPIQIVGNDTIFLGESTTLIASGALTYFWNNGQTGSSITVAPLTTTTYQVTGYDANGCTSTKAFTVVIDRFEPNILGDEEVCLGGSVTLTADAGLNATYLWSTGETTASIQVNPGVTTTYSLSVTSQTGAIGNTDFTVVVLDLPIVDLQPTVAVCQSETEVMLNYTVNSGNPTHCNIYFDAAAQTAGFPAVSNHVPLDYGTLTIALPNGVAYGSYTIEVEFINDNGCVGNISNATINILLDNMIVLKWDDVLICDNIHHLYAEYQWYKNDRIISGASMQYYSETGGFNGEYYVVATKHDGTKHQSCPVFFQTAYAPQISMSPNPVQRFASVNLIIPFTTEELEGAYLTIHDMTGRLIEQSKEVSSSMNMPVAYPAGMYMLVVHLKDGTTKGLKFLVNE